MSNVKLGLGTLACLLAFVAQVRVAVIAQQAALPIVYQTLSREPVNFSSSRHSTGGPIVRHRGGGLCRVRLGHRALIVLPPSIDDIFSSPPQFWPNPLKPMPFPESRGLLLVCCVLYFAISFGLQLLATLHEKDAILFTFAPNATSPCFSPGMEGRRLRVGSALPRFSVDYTLTIEVLEADGKPLDKVERVLKLTDYFEEGAFHEGWFMDDVKDAVVTHAVSYTHLTLPTIYSV